MEQIVGSPFEWLKFNKDGALTSPSQADAIRTMVTAQGVTDLVVISHGWKNDEADARRLYEMLWRNVVAALTTRGAGSIVLVGVEWPAKAFKTDFDTASLQVEKSGGTLSASPPAGVLRRDLTDAELRVAFDEFDKYLEGDGQAVVAAAKGILVGGALDPNKAAALFAASSRLLGVSAAADTEIQEDTKPLGAAEPHQRLLALARPPALKAQPGLGAAQSLRSVVGEVFAGPRAAIARFLNQLTYFEMKSRAGVVGRHLGADVLPKLSIPAHVRLHLVGHSFGARLVIAAASALPNAVPLYSLTLLQGAFSHNAMAALVRPGLPGAFANVVGRPTGPIVMTHTHNDEACTFWYAIASRLSRDVAKAIGDKDDAFGAMGANGAQKLNPEVLAQDVSDLNFRPVAGKVNRFLADSYVVKTDTLDAHNNVTNPTVGRLVASVLDMPAA
jgi:hypothetical protein